jgi:glutathione S-transferase
MNDQAPPQPLKLYNWPTSTCSQKVRLVLSEKELQWEDAQLDWRNDEQVSDWYLAINENGVVPTLMHGARAITDSSVINEYLEEVFPQAPLLPSDPYERARVRAWRQYIDEVPTQAIRIPSFNRRIVPAMARLSDAEFETRVGRRTLRKQFYKRMGRDGFTAQEVEDSREKLRDTVVRMNRSLQNNHWLASERLSLADASVLPTIVRMDDLGLSALWADCPLVEDWYRRWQSRPSFALTYTTAARVRAAAE